MAKKEITLDNIAAKELADLPALKPQKEAVFTKLRREATEKSVLETNKATSIGNIPVTSVGSGLTSGTTDVKSLMVKTQEDRDRAVEEATAKSNTFADVMKDALRGNNSIGQWIIDNDTYVKDKTPLNLSDPVLAGVISKLHPDDQDYLYKSASSQENAFALAERYKRARESLDESSKRNGVLTFAADSLAGVISPGTLLTAGFGATATLAKNAFFSTGKFIAQAAAINGASTVIDSAIFEYQDIQREVTKEVAYSFALGGAFGTVIAPFAVNSAIRSGRFQTLDDAMNPKPMYEGTADATTGHSVAPLTAVKETQIVKKEVDAAPESSVYKKAYDDWKKAYDDSVIKYQDHIDEIDAVEVPELTAAKANLDAAKADYEASLKSHNDLTAADLGVADTTPVTVRKMSPVEEAFDIPEKTRVTAAKTAAKTDIEAMKAQQALDSAPIKTKITEIDKTIKALDKTSNMATPRILAKIKALDDSMVPIMKTIAKLERSIASALKAKTPKSDVRAAALQKELDGNKNALDVLQKQKKDLKGPEFTPEQAAKKKKELTVTKSRLQKSLEDLGKQHTKAMNTLLSERVAGQPKVGSRSVNRWVDTIIDRKLTPTAYKKNMDTAKASLFEAEVKPKAEALAAAQKAFDDMAKYVKSQKKAAKAELKKPSEGKFVAPKVIEEEEIETGKTLLEGMVYLPQMQKFLTDYLPGDTLPKLFKSDVDQMYQSPSLEIRNAAFRLSAPSHSIKVFNLDGTVSRLTVKQTANDYKIGKIQGFVNRRTRNLQNAYAMALKEGAVKNMDEFIEQVSNEYAAMVREHDRLAYAHARANTDDLTDAEKLKKGYDETNPEVPQTKWKEDGVNSYRAYYNTMRDEADSINLKGMTGLSKNQWYMPIRYNNNLLDNFDEANISYYRDNAYKALRRHPAQDNMTDAEVKKLADTLISKLQAGEFKKNLTFSTFVTTDTPLGQHQLAKQYHFDVAQMGDLVMQNMETVARAYHYKMSGRLALQKSFETTDVSEIMNGIRDAAIANGRNVPKADLEAMQHIVEDILGTLRLNQFSGDLAWRFARSLKMYHVARLLGNSGVLQMAETATAIGWHATRGVFNSNFGAAISDAIEFAHKKGGEGTDYNNFLMDFGFFSEALSMNNATKYGDVEAGMDPGIIEGSLNKVANLMMKLNLMNTTLAFQESYTGAVVLGNLRKFNPDKLSQADLSRLSRMGLTADEFRELQRDILLHCDPDPSKKFNIGAMSEINRDRLQLAVSRGIRETTIYGDSIHTPNWLKAPKGPIQSLMYQFLKFPFTAHATLLRVGLSEENAAMVWGSALGASTFIAIKALQEEATVALGFKKEEDRKWDILNDPDHMKNALMTATLYNSFLGVTGTLVQNASTFIGVPLPGKEYAQKQTLGSFNPTLSLVEDIMKLSKSAAEGNLATEKSAMQLFFMTFFATLPIYSDGARNLIKEEF